MTHAEAALLTEAVMFTVAVISFFFAVPHFWNERLRRRGVKGRGVCVSHSISRDGKVSCVIRFRLPDGDSVTFTTPRSSQPSAEIRQRVDVIYDPRKPKRAVIAYTLPKDGTPVRRFLIGMAVIFVVALGIRIYLGL
ncbi:DUF3592 domain-containing protein [Streptomyces sp. NPDC005526]|uniref:DUF3592 domain-containing protein n=1 Tax=Streptomyces sp. NPDC005526 TaxID=3156885 RepID=UPI0033A3FBF6